MTFRRLFLVAGVVVAASAFVACGDYSNEDLLFMSAVPSSAQLAVALPAAPANAMEAELAQDTHSGIATVNAVLDDVLGLIDTVRSYEPTSRSANSRTWGPFADSNHPGWQWQLQVSRASEDATTFTYELDFASTANPGNLVQFLTGTFDFAGGAKQGNGMVTAHFGDALAAGYPLDATTSQYDTLTIAYQNYQTPGSPVSVTLTINRATPDQNGVTMVMFTYEILADGSGEITFMSTGNIVAGTGTETVTIHAQWLPSGAGMGTLTIVAGTDVGLTQTECWDATFEATYNDKPWSTTEDTGAASLCPSLPTFP
jgi:hypothetical protein